MVCNQSSVFVLRLLLACSFVGVSRDLAGNHHTDHGVVWPHRCAMVATAASMCTVPRWCTAVRVLWSAAGAFPTCM